MVMCTSWTIHFLLTPTRETRMRRLPIFSSTSAQCHRPVSLMRRASSRGSLLLALFPAVFGAGLRRVLARGLGVNWLWRLF